LSSALGFSLDSLHLVFHVIPVPEGAANANINLSQSVASVADTFLHEELSPPEEATLWRSFQEEAAVTQSDYILGQIPGGLGFSSVIHEDQRKSEVEPAGVSIFATLIEKLLARFEFDAQNIQVTLVHPENMSLTLSLEEIRYHTTSKDQHSPASGKDVEPQGESRTVTLTGTSISSKDLSAFPIASPSYLAPHTLLAHSQRHSDVSIPRNLSWSSDSSLDEDTQFEMSQSLASLPPRRRSPTSSVSSSMYESAISTVPPILQSTVHLPERSLNTAQALEDPLKATDRPLFPSQQLLSFGSQSITLRLTTPSPSVQAEEDNPFESPADPACSDDTQIRVDLSIGIVPCVVRPQQVWGLLCLAQAISPNQDGNMETSRAQLATPSKVPPLKLDAHVRGMVFLLLPFSADTDINSSHLAQFFNHPVVPPTLDCGYTRLYLESLSATLSISDVRNVEGSSIQQGTVISFDSSLADVSAFIINPVSELLESGAGVLALPLLMTDPHLASQYSGAHSHPGSTGIYPKLPTFDIIDWKAKKSRNFGMKVSQWRSQPPKLSTPHRTKPHQANESHFSSNLSQAAVRIIGNRTVTPTQGGAPSDVNFGSVEVQIAPLNIRLDLEHTLQPGGPVSFFEDVLALESSDQDSISSERTVEEHETLPRSRVAGNSNSRFDPNLGDEQSNPEPCHIVSRQIILYVAQVTQKDRIRRNNIQNSCWCSNSLL
jgi:autophagy-related protein 2